MASSRTGTGIWQKIRDERRRIALSEGIHNCPRCRTKLDWEYSQRPNSAEVDHILAHIQGGTDTLSNTRILCRKCNQQLGQLAKPKRVRTVIQTTELDNSGFW